MDGTGELMRQHHTEGPPRGEVASGPVDAVRLPEAGVTRRGFLAVAGLTAAAVIAGGIASREAPWRDWLGAAEERLGVGIPGAVGVQREYTLDSRYVDEPVAYSIAWPPGSEPGDPLPVCFALPGRGGGPPMGFAGFVAAAVRRGESRPYAVVGVDGGVSYWHRRKTGEDRLSMLLRELVPLCRRRFKLGGGGRRRAVIGWSMGGYGALLAAETEPRLFAAVVAVSPAVWTSYAAMMLGPRDAFDGAADFARYDVIAHAGRLAGVNLRVDCGRQDPFYGYVTHLDAALPRSPSGGYSTGGHDQDYWSRVAPAEAEFIGRALR
ncbi:MAG: alpha/beta hydrolase-fold protein [Deltaproteobacteria bacterium]